MANPFESDDLTYRVLINAEGQHSLWPAFRPTPEGWAEIGPTASREICLAWIETHWTDMRPKSRGDSNLSGDP